MPQIATTPADILTAAKAALVTASVVTTAQAFLSESPEDPPPGSASFPLVGLAMVGIDRLMETMHAPETTDDSIVVEMEMTATLWTKTLFDTPGTDTTALTHASLGQSVLLTKIVRTFNATNLASGLNTLTWRPMWLVGLRNKGRLRKGEEGLRSVGVRFNVAFEWDLVP